MAYDILYAQKFPRHVNFVDFTITYWYSKNLIRENLLVCNNYRFVTIHKMLPFHDEPVIRENIIAKILFTSCSAKISYRKNFRVYGNQWESVGDILAICRHLLDESRTTFGKTCVRLINTFPSISMPSTNSNVKVGLIRNWQAVEPLKLLCLFFISQLFIPLSISVWFINIIYNTESNNCKHCKR